MKIRLLVILLLLLLVMGCTSQEDQVCINSNCFTVEIADSPPERAKGLMFREQLDDDKGMLFLYNEERVYSFWMKNTLIPLDIIWINSNHEIVFISRQTPPCEADPCPSYNQQHEAQYILEINGGLADELNIKEGDIAQLQLS